MGDCASKPSDLEIEAHLNDTNPKNDSQFRYIPNDFMSFIHISDETDISFLQQKMKFINKKKKELIYKEALTLQDFPSIPELNVEIQKGVNFYNSGVCFSQGKPYVTISLEPHGPIMNTNQSDALKPI